MVAQPCQEQLGVSPRAHGQRDVDAPLAKVPELMERLAQEQVLPAAEQQHRHLDPVKGGADVQRPPERVVVRRRRQPGLPPRSPFAEQRPAGRAQRRLRGRTHHALLSPHLADAGADSVRIFLVRNQIAPAEEVVDRERAGTPRRRAQIMGTGGDDGRDQFRRRILQQRVLSEPQVRDPDGGEAAGEPRLPPHPFDRVGAVGCFVGHGHEVSGRSECPSHTLQHHAISAGSVQIGENQRERKSTAVGSAGQQGADGFPDGFINVGDQLDTVAHRDFHAADGVARRRRRQPQCPGEGAAGEPSGKGAQRRSCGLVGGGRHGTRLWPHQR